MFIRNAREGRKRHRGRSRYIALGTDNRGIGVQTEAFDERLTRDRALAVVSPFINSLAHGAEADASRIRTH